MSIRVRLPGPLQGYAGGRAEVPVAGDTVGDALARLAERYPPMARHLFAEDGKLRSFVAVFLNDDDVRHLGGLSAAVGEGDVLYLVPNVAGGRGRTGAALPLRP
ncbi:MAG TPA: ubiquitin-like small modifier protein 1 [Longimicrobium sp.]|nr:ubiquitin-like small modifier protein 1 [Longimicrobium sp.]